MPVVNRVQPLVCTPAVALEQFDHPPGVVHRDPEEERAASHAVGFVEAGRFRVRVGGVWRELTPHHLLVTTPGLEFSCQHDDDYPDDRCLVVRFSAAAIESLWSLGAPTAPAPVLPLTNRRAYLQWQLRAAGPAAGGLDPARTEALAGALYGTFGRPDGRTAPLFRPHQLSWYAERMDQAKERIRVHFAEPLSLSDLAREVGMSVFHFARVFHELEGQPPHRYLVQVRLAAAAARLRDGDRVTTACFAAGFSSLSHFVSTFRRHFGIRPSALGKRS